MKKLTDDDLRSIRERLASTTPGPWFYNSYAGIFSEPMCKLHSSLEALIPDDASDEEWERLPETIVAYVPTIAGDTATSRGMKDALFIAAARQDVEDLLTEVDTLREQVTQKTPEGADVQGESDTICRLRGSLCRSLDALGNGAYASDRVSVEFMELIPGEIEGVVNELRSKNSGLEDRAELITEKLKEAIEIMNEMVEYVPEELAEKFHYRDYIRSYENVLVK